MPQITIDRNNIDEAVQVIADTIGSAVEKVRDLIYGMIEYHQLLQSEGDTFTLIYGEPAQYEETTAYKLKQLVEEFEETMKHMDYVIALASFEAPFQPIPYTERLHPRKDGYVKPYWLRIRSNPYRRNYH